MNSEFKFIGNIGRPPEDTKSGDGIKFSICVNDSYKKDNQWINTPHWFNISAFGYTKQSVISQGIKKGDKILVMGQIKTYTPKDSKLSTSTFQARQVYKIMSTQSDTASDSQEVPSIENWPDPVYDNEEIPF